jgi:hypothetical protein
MHALVNNLDNVTGGWGGGWEQAGNLPGGGGGEEARDMEPVHCKKIIRGM